MNTPSHAFPIKYGAELERFDPDETSAIRGLEQTLLRIQQTTARDYGYAVRGVHAKAHALVRGRLRIHADLPDRFAQGLFAAPREHDVILRFSSNPGDLLDDAISVPRGLAVKVLDVVGPRVLEAPEPGVQDFLLATGEAFGAPTPARFLKLLRLLALTTDRGEIWKIRLSRLLGAFQGMLRAIGRPSRTLARLGGAPNLHPLGATYFSQTPFRYGRHIAKFQIAPVSAPLQALAGRTVNTRRRRDALREDINTILTREGGVWEFRVQLCIDLDTMPIEDATAVWSAKRSPFVTVATLTVPPQPSWQPASDAIDRQLAFTVWNSLSAHRPLGGINRARRLAYESSSGYRADFNGCPVHAAARLTDWSAG